MLFFLCIILFAYFIVSSYESFPAHDPSQAVYTNPEWDTRDHPGCGKFRAPPPSYLSRVYKGKETYAGQFPWMICLLTGKGRYLYEDTNKNTQEIFKRVKHNIWQVGYDFSNNRFGSYSLRTLSSWDSFCTGSIIDNSWILTAAHCFYKKFESFVIVANAGVNECAGAGTLRTIVLSRIEGHRTLFEPPEWITGGDAAASIGAIGNSLIASDIALIRLDIPYTNTELPEVNYDNQLMNRICIYSQSGLNKYSCLKNVYFAGYGLKTNPNTTATARKTFDPKLKLTYYESYRTSMETCKIISGRGDVAGKYCYNPVLRHYGMEEKSDIEEKNIDQTDFNIEKDSELYDASNTCSGDSGGPFFHYIMIDGNNTNNALAEGYRALQLSTLFGIFLDPDEPGETYCDYEYRTVIIPSIWPWGSPMRMRIKAIDIGTMLWTLIDSKFWTDTIDTKETGQLVDTSPHSGVTYPDVP